MKEEQEQESASIRNECFYSTLQTAPETLLYDIINEHAMTELDEEYKALLMSPLSSPQVNDSKLTVAVLKTTVNLALKFYYEENTHWTSGTPHNYLMTTCMFLSRGIPEVSQALAGAVVYDPDIKMTTMTDAAIRFRDQRLLKCNFQNAPLLACFVAHFLSEVKATPGAVREPFKGCLVILFGLGICVSSLLLTVGMMSCYFK